ncbi:MAG: PemK family transcriptional regulator [Candidatus Diapherotrites archaeon CG08_land_8_20_14_0_20_34_12]|nr:MAG: PemK family transcriptional regulator [Candidatus Diapherotrites archaeon CG08_land_8_20_14_0_20_34_12]
MNIKRGDIILADFEPVKGSEQGKTRPCLIIQNDFGNVMSPTTIVAAITSRIEKEYPFTVFVQKDEGNLSKDSLILCNYLRTISKEHRIITRLGALNSSTMKKVDKALKISLALG